MSGDERAAKRLEEDRETWELVMDSLGRYAPIEAVSMAARELGISYGTARNRYLRYGDHLRMARASGAGEARTEGESL